MAHLHASLFIGPEVVFLWRMAEPREVYASQANAEQYEDPEEPDHAPIMAGVGGMNIAACQTGAKGTQAASAHKGRPLRLLDTMPSPASHPAKLA